MIDGLALGLPTAIVLAVNVYLLRRQRRESAARHAQEMAEIRAHNARMAQLRR